MNKFLNGIRVIEIGNFISGPFAAELLADMGAEVIKIEKPEGGDPFRSFSQNLMSPEFCFYNRGKRSVTADITTDGGREFLLRLVDGADVLVENLRPDVLPRLGLGWDILHKRNRRLIYCNISGFGPDGPYSKRPAYDTVAQATSGFFSLLLDPDHPRIAGPPMADGISGLYAALGIVSAIAARANDGEGHRLDVAMIEAMVAFATIPQPENRFVTRSLRPRGRIPIICTPLLGREAHQLASVIAAKILGRPARGDRRPDIGKDARFSTRAGRVKHHGELSTVLGSVFAERPRSEWEARLQRADVPHAPILNYFEVEADPQILHLKTFYDFEHTKLGPMRGVQSPIWSNREREVPALPPPMLGEHTDEQARLVKFTDEEIADLRAQKAI